MVLNVMHFLILHLPIVNSLSQAVPTSRGFDKGIRKASTS